ncbi:ribonuclease H-like domain-containing protein [Balneolaceae bacterium ANBcel3]|nr:ribonuclease H-like domain-containing protein [Balneolaceae bacterium ANBcel3]
MYFVFDIESIPDIPFLRNLVADSPEDDEALLEVAAEELGRGKSNFLPPMYHQMVSWVGLWITDSGEPRQKVSWTGSNEKDGLVELIHTLTTYKDFGVIHHNGKGFDLPLITYRAMKFGLQLPSRLNAHDIRYRFSKQNYDLMDEFSNFGASSYPKLKHIGALINIPLKVTGEGNEVLSMFREGKMEQIERYCYEDVMATYLIWLHLQYTIGSMKKNDFENLRDRAKTKLIEIQTESGETPKK